ncbi:MAG TPA: hypothetical protein VF721_09130 [Pyrinomonadaceae bacterium]|jgi:hypothetical protein
MKIRCLLLTVLFLAVASVGLAQSKTPTFKQYSAKVEKIRNVNVNLRSHKRANMFRTNLRNAAKEGVNFAGHFILTTWGCGTNCSQSAIIDARSGRVFFPDELEGAGFGFCELPADVEPLVYKPESRLLVLNGFKGGDLDKENGRCGIYYLEWTGAAFKQVRFVQKKRTDTP